MCDHAGCDEPVKAKVTFTADDTVTTTDYLFCSEHASLGNLLAYATKAPYSHRGAPTVDQAQEPAHVHGDRAMQLKVDRSTLRQSCDVPDDATTTARRQLLCWCAKKLQRQMARHPESFDRRGSRR